MKYSDGKKISLKEKIKLYLKINDELVVKKDQLEDISSLVLKINEELSSLKKEVLELKDFINGKFNSEFNENYDYKVNINNCYVISLNGKKYITLREDHSTDLGIYPIDGKCYMYSYKYFDVLSVLDKNSEDKFRLLCGYSKESYYDIYVGNKPESEEHILKLYPELKMYEDGNVPNTHLKKIYYEINNLGDLSPSKEKNVGKVKKLN